MIDIKPIEPMVRVPRGEYTWLGRALDLGARGLMIPMVESPEQAAAIVHACRYPPMGRRGAAVRELVAHVDGTLTG